MNSRKFDIEKNSLDKIEELLLRSQNEINELKIDFPETSIDLDFKIDNMIDSIEPDDYSSPGVLEFRMDPLKMHLFMTLEAPINSDNEITIEDIKIEIEKIGPFCEERVNWKLIIDVYERVMFDSEIIPEIKIASGLPVQAKVPEYYTLNKSLSPDYVPESKKDGRVDFHSIKPFVIVKKNEHIGTVHSEVLGVDGTNLYGEKIHAPVIIKNGFKIGENVIVHKGHLYSNIDGSLKIIDNEICINHILNVEESVDYSTGNIDFSGDVFVPSLIREGFEVKSGKNLFVKKTVEPSNLICGNDLIVEQGILGNEKYKIECHGSVITKYIDNVTLNCCGDVLTQNEIIHSRIKSKGRLILGKDSVITGGTYYFQNGCTVGSVGSNHGDISDFVLGVDVFIEDKIKLINNTIVQLSEQIENIKLNICQYETVDNKKKALLFSQQLTVKVNSMKDLLNDLVRKVDKNENAQLYAYGTVFPGTKIQICHISTTVKEEITGATFFLDKINGKISYKRF